MTEWQSLTEESRKRWDANAAFWDDYMGDDNNRYYNELIRPYTEALLAVRKGDTILDVACGHGNFSRRLTELGASVVAIDYSSVLIEKAKLRSQKYEDIDYKVVDATNAEAMVGLGKSRYDAAVANMALMDISEIKPLANALFQLLKEGGKFVFSFMHPCFQNSGSVRIYEKEKIDAGIEPMSSIKISDYIQPVSYEGDGIHNQPTPHIFFHRPLSMVFNTFFAEGFVLDGIEEPVFKKAAHKRQFNWSEIPPVIICRVKKE